MSRARASVAVVIALTVATACGGGSRQNWAGTAGDVRIQAREYSFSNAGRVRPGIVGLQLVNAGEEPHQATVFRLNPGTTAADALEAFRRDPSGATVDRMMSTVGGINTILPGRAARLALRVGAGGYALFCFVRGGDGQLHAQRGMVAGLTVAGIARRGVAPRTAGTVVLRDTGIELPAAVSRRQATLRVRNEGTRLHELALLHLPGGRSVADLTAWLDALSRGVAAGPAPFLEAGGVTALPPKAEAWLRTDLDSGPQVAASFAAAADGRADALVGLLVPFAVP